MEHNLISPRNQDEKKITFTCDFPIHWCQWGCRKKADGFCPAAALSAGMGEVQGLMEAVGWGQLSVFQAGRGSSQGSLCTVVHP